MTEEKVDHLEPVKEMVENVGIKMPELVAEGDLTITPQKETIVIKDKETSIVDDAKKKKETSLLKKKDIPLPQLGKIFMFEGNEYKVVYINDGQHRFTCEPYKGEY